MTPQRFIDLALAPGLSLLPARMDTPEARAVLLAIALQESDGLRSRRQYAGGPARGYFQFERNGGVAGVLGHPASKSYAFAVCRSLDILPLPYDVWTAIEFHDPLATVFARLLLWTDPGSLPARDAAEHGWSVYLRTWRPGKPHPAKWGTNFGVAWDVIDTTPSTWRRA